MEGTSLSEIVHVLTFLIIKKIISCCWFVSTRMGSAGTSKKALTTTGKAVNFHRFLNRKT